MTPVAIDRIAPVWQWVRKGLDDIRERCAESWTTGDVYNALMAGQAVLYIAGQEDGFMVCRKQVDSVGPILFVWALWGDMQDEQDKHFAFADELARSIGADRIRMESPRKGWARYFKVKTMVYEREVS